MLLPPLCSQEDYVKLATGAGLITFSKPFDISQKVSKTWYVLIIWQLGLSNLFDSGTYHGLSFSLQPYGHLL